MIESQQVLEWIAEGEAKGRAESEAELLLRLLALRFPPGASAALITQIRATRDADQLTRWFDAAVLAPSLEAFQQSMAP